MDSATGAALIPERLEVRGGQGQGRQLGPEEFLSSGAVEINLEHGTHALGVIRAGYKPVSGPFHMRPGNGYEIRFLLDPIEEPEQIRPENVETLRRDGFMLVQGFLVDDNSGALLKGVAVTDLKSGGMAISDDAGFFRLHVPAAEEMESTGALLVQKAGYKSQALHNVEIWSRGDCTYRLRLQRGGGTEVIDESALRRRAPSVASGQNSAPTPSASLLSSQAVEPSVEPPQPATLPENATVRVPRNIRVLQTNKTTIDYVSFTYYSRAVLGSEWIASWGDIAGGTNSLNAGAVAVRCYAIAKFNNISTLLTNEYDICGTTSCQVYNPFKIHGRTDTAVNYTANWVLVSGAGIASTEYSAENNSLVETTYGCPDGFTEPNSSCLYDPICAGQSRYGHGRGMCQWGTARWATGRRMNGRFSGDTTPSGFPLRDWRWIVQHYYPALTFVKGAPLVVGDDVKALKTLDVRACPGGEITNGVNCALVATKSAGATGVILAGPVTVTNDGKGLSWYKIDWGNATGWSVENFIERVFSTPSTPANLVAQAVATNRIQLNWTDTTDVEAGFEIERAPSSGGPWVEIATVAANSTSYLDDNLLAGDTWYYRVRAYNAGGSTAYSANASATTVVPAPVIAALAPATIPEEQLFTRTATASVMALAKGFGDLYPFPSESANGSVLFRLPGFSGSTQSYLEATPNISAVTDAFPSTGFGTGKVLRVRFAFANVANPWLRLTTGGASYYPNPVIDLTRILQFRVYSDKAIGLAVGLRETSTPAGTALGTDGGNSGGIEWAGVTNIAGTAPMCTRIIPAGVWTTVSLDLQSEPIRNFTGGNGVLSTASGLGVLEHLAIVPQAGTGEYNVYVAGFQVVEPRTVAWSLGTASPAGSSIHSVTGVIDWIPSESQGPGVYPIQVIATASGSQPKSSTNTFNLTVSEVNRPPVLDPFSNPSVHAGAVVTFTNTASDPDLPANTLSFDLSGNPAGAQIDAVDGVFTWATTSQNAGTTNLMTVRVFDNGIPQAWDSEPLTITILPAPQLSPAMSGEGTLALTWQTIPGTSYAVQYKDDLAVPTWQPLTNFVAATVTSTVTNDFSAPRRFFRVIAE